MRWRRRDPSRWSAPEPLAVFVVAAERDPLPTMLDIVDPAGAGGAVVGVPVKVGRGTVIDDRGCLEEPLAPGDGFCVVSGSQAVVTIAVAAAEGSAPQIEVALQSPGRAVGAAVLLATCVADRTAALTDGAVDDLTAQRVFRAGDWRVTEPLGAIDVREHAVIHVLDDAARGTVWAHTHGLLKFGRPELEVRDAPQQLSEAATAALLDVAQYVAEGALIAPGHTLGARAKPLLAVLGRDDDHWNGVPVLELVEATGQRSGATSGLTAWAASAV